MRTRRRLLWAAAVILVLAAVMSVPAAAQASPTSTQAASNCTRALNGGFYAPDGWLVNSNPLCRVIFIPMHVPDFKCLDVQGGSTADRTPIVQYQCLGQDGAPHQQWGLLEVGADIFQLRARHSGKCADVSGGSTANGAPLIQYTCTGLPNQEFRLREVHDT